MEKNQQRNKRSNNRSKFVCSWFLKIWDICSKKTENENQYSKIKEFMYEKLCYISSTSKYEKSNSNINIAKISHLTFDMLCYLFE